MIVAEGSRSREDGKEGDAWWMMMIDDEKWTWQMNLMTLMWWEYTTDWCFYGGFTQTNFYIFHREFLRTKKIRREVVTQRNFYTETFTQKYLYKENVYTQTGWHTHRNFWKHLHKKHFLQENFYIQKLLHRKKKCTEQLLHTDGRDLVAPAALREIWKDTSRPPRN